jgi:hypothetical protein
VKERINGGRCKPDELDWSDAQRQKRAVAEYLAALEAEAGSPVAVLPFLEQGK